MNTGIVAGCSPELAKIYRSVPMRDGATWAQGSGSKAIIGGDDRVALQLAGKLEGFYPVETVKALIRKDQMPLLLGANGFRQLDTVRVRSVADISMRDFILKPILGSGSAPFVGGESMLAYRKFADRNELLQFFRPDQIEREFARGFIAQQAEMSADHVTASVGGTVNGRSEPLFVRSSISTWRGAIIVHTFRGHDLPGMDEIKNLLRDFFPKAGIRNTTFSLQLIQLGGVFYPMDWNFHIAATYVRDAMKKQPEEFHAAIHHMMDISVDRFTAPKEKWSIDRCDKGNGVMFGTYSNDYIKAVA